MALKDCKFFADINGRQVEIDFDEFRAYLLQDNVMATLAPDLTGKRGEKAGFTLTAQKAETAAVKTEAAATKAEAPSGNVVTVTAEPADAQRIADSDCPHARGGEPILIRSHVSPDGIVPTPARPLRTVPADSPIQISLSNVNFLYRFLLPWWSEV